MGYIFGAPTGSIAYVYQDNDVVISVNFDDNSYELTPQTIDNNYPVVTDPVPGEGGDVAFIIKGAYIHEGERTLVYIEIDWDKKAIRIQKMRHQDKLVLDVIGMMAQGYLQYPYQVKCLSYLKQ
nr:hypothetical protein QOL21_00335 [Acholeplasma laidlawii]